MGFPYKKMQGEKRREKEMDREAVGG